MVNIEKWDFMCKNINWEKLYFTMTDMNHVISTETLMKFSALEEKHLLILRGNDTMFFREGLFDNVLHSPAGYYLFTDHNRAIENHFDLLGWLCG